MKNFSQWKEAEVKSLFNYVEKAKANNKSLLEGFREYARKSKRKANSVRNYYYLETEQLKRDKERAKRLGIDVSKHNINHADKFTPEETEKLVLEILRLKCLGNSIRKACLKLGNNSVEEMLRYQNKFRNVMKNNRPLYNKCLLKLKESGLSKEPRNENVIYMKKPEERKITDEDVNTLFLGLVKLVKKNAIENIEKNLLKNAELANSTLRESMVRLASLEKEVEYKTAELNNINEKNRIISEENLALKTKIAGLMGEKLVKSKNKSLTKYLRDIKEKGLEVKTKI